MTTGRWRQDPLKWSVMFYNKRRHLVVRNFDTHTAMKRWLKEHHAGPVTEIKPPTDYVNPGTEK